jgi:hypothetical protein
LLVLPRTLEEMLLLYYLNGNPVKNSWTNPWKPCQEWLKYTSLRKPCQEWLNYTILAETLSKTVDPIHTPCGNPVRNGWTSRPCGNLVNNGWTTQSLRKPCQEWLNCTILNETLSGIVDPKCTQSLRKPCQKWTLNLFWNQILICRSVRLRFRASSHLKVRSVNGSLFDLSW